MTGTVETFSEVLKITNKLVGFKLSLSSTLVLSVG